MGSSEPAWRQSHAVREHEFYRSVIYLRRRDSPPARCCLPTFRYYDPFRTLSEADNGLSEPSIRTFDPTEPRKPRSSPDTTLTAFCQLGALRTGALRCMLTFFDTQYAYVLAEATKTLSLRDDDVHNSEDSLWMGYTTVQRGLSVCEQTIDLPPEDVKDGAETSSCVNVINDLSEDSTFCNRPFVTGDPKLRFYAGVPITTPVRRSSCHMESHIGTNTPVYLSSIVR